MKERIIKQFELEALESIIRNVYDPWDDTPMEIATAIQASELWRNRTNTLLGLPETWPEYDR